MTDPITIIAVTVAAEGQETRVREAQERLVIETLSEPGCLRYELNQSIDDPRVLIFTETWATEAAWRAHMDGAAMQRFQASGASRLLSDFTLFRARRVAGAG
ncbi:putative quinol monooxygenase [Sphingomonas sp.]|uniref:putative quinol monooxygenase n=1 Tax=Sphingomonas sp. TaxID=28214 RepID=UPI002FD9272E